MINFGVRHDKEQQLLLRMLQLGIDESDLSEKFIRSSGPGGQHTNKTSTCVQLKHIPSGIVVKVQKTRSRELNRFLARRLLVIKLENRVHGVKSAEAQRIFKLRKQKKKRSKKAKEKILHDKRKLSAKKESRKEPRQSDLGY